MVLKYLSVLLAGVLVFAAENSVAQTKWTITRQDASAFAPDIVPDNRAKAINGLPDGRIASAGGNATIVKAWYAKPTGRYKHDVLGDAIEAGALVVETDRGVRLKYLLQETDVFEDITPRLADLDGDGKTEVITIQSNLLAGASIAIYQVSNNTLVRSAQSRYIGRPFRWLNIAGIANYTGNRTPEIALVITPHIGGILELYKFHQGKLFRLFAERGFSNHFIGSREQRLSASYLDTSSRRVNLALPSADRKSLMIMATGARGWIQKGIAHLPAPIDKAIGVSLNGGRATFTLGLSNGSVYSISQQ